MFAERLINEMALQKENGFYRNPLLIDERNGTHIKIDGRDCINFSSNDYLGLCKQKEIQKQISSNFNTYNHSSSSSRIVTGNTALILQAEKRYAEYFGYEDALFFPSGYQANLAVMGTLFKEQDVVFYDKHIHASTIKGMALNSARCYGYNHSSFSHLEKRLEQHKNHSCQAVATESLFSMDGDVLDVASLEKLKSRHEFICIVDEAHSFGVLGEKGRGLGHQVADIAIGTFGKAFALFGAFVLLPAIFKEYLLNFSSPLIYTTALPDAHTASVLDLLSYVESSDHLRERLAYNNSLMKRSLTEYGFDVKGDAHIIAVEIGDEMVAQTLSNEMLKNGFVVYMMRFPTVPMSKAILRISMSSTHTEKEIEKFASTLRKIYEKTKE